MSVCANKAEVKRRRGAVILCGGRSSRMGRDKVWLPFGKEALLERVVRIVAEAAPVENIVVVAAAGQELPKLPVGVRIVSDEAPNRGPLPAIAGGLSALPTSVDAAFVTACDAPLLQAAVVEFLFELLGGDADVLVPADEERLYPLTGVYQRTIASRLNEAIAAGEYSPQRALRSSRVRLRCLPTDTLRTVDAELNLLARCNTPEEYAAAIEAVRAGGY